jgi:hypothetical protein
VYSSHQAKRTLLMHEKVVPAQNQTEQRHQDHHPLSSPQLHACSLLMVKLFAT